MMKILRFGLLASTLIIGGCISTGVRVGPVFIPVDTGIGKKKAEPEEDPDEKLPPRSQKRDKLEVSDNQPEKDNKDDKEKATEEEDDPPL